MKALTNACGIVLTATTIATGASIVGAPTASADIGQSCSVIPAHDFHMGPKRGYPPRYRFFMHVKAITICHVTWNNSFNGPPFNNNPGQFPFNNNPGQFPFNNTGQFTFNRTPFTFNLGRINFSGTASAI